MPNNLKLYAYVALGLAAMLPPGKGALAETHYDIVKDFNVKSNPNGVWTYMDSAPLVYHHHRFEGASGVDVWSNDQTAPGMLSIARNKTGETLMLKDGRVTFPPDYLLLLAQDDRPGAIVQFTAPVAGTYTLKGNFLGLAQDAPHRHPLAILFNSAQGQQQLYVSFAIYMRVKNFKSSIVMAQGDTLVFQCAADPTHKDDDIGVAAEIVGP